MIRIFSLPLIKKALSGAFNESSSLSVSLFRLYTAKVTKNAAKNKFRLGDASNNKKEKYVFKKALIAINKELDTSSDMKLSRLS